MVLGWCCHPTLGPPLLPVKRAWRQSLEGIWLHTLPARCPPVIKGRQRAPPRGGPQPAARDKAVPNLGRGTSPTRRGQRNAPADRLPLRSRTPGVEEQGRESRKAIEGASRLPTGQDQAQKSSEPPQASREPHQSQDRQGQPRPAAGQGH